MVWYKQKAAQHFLLLFSSEFTLNDSTKCNFSRMGFKLGRIGGGRFVCIQMRLFKENYSRKPDSGDIKASD